MRWVLIIGLAWPAVSVGTALLIGAAIRLAEKRRIPPDVEGREAGPPIERPAPIRLKGNG